jgi:hypothetical protein
MEHILADQEEITQVINCLLTETKLRYPQENGYSFEHNLISSGAMVGTKKCP